MSDAYQRPFQPRGLGSFIIPNAVAASTPYLMPGGFEQITLYNTDTAAIAYVEISNIDLPTDAGRNAVVPVGTATPGSFPVPPGQQLRISTGKGNKTISAIASAATGNLIVTMGFGN